jgi:hypothetical protein
MMLPPLKLTDTHVTQKGVKPVFTSFKLFQLHLLMGRPKNSANDVERRALLL